MTQSVRRSATGVVALWLVSCAAAQAQLGVVSTSGAAPFQLVGTIEVFKQRLGGEDNGVGGTFANGRREIDWDNVADASAAPAGFPGDTFNTTFPLGAVFNTPGNGLQVSMDDDTGADADPDQVRFSHLRADYDAELPAFSAQRLFSPIGSTITDIIFFVPGTTQRATVKGVGVVFVDVDVLGSATIELFDIHDVSLGSVNAPVGKFSFLGLNQFDIDAPFTIARARITSGNASIGVADAPPAADVVVIDNVMFGEPQAPTVAFSLEFTSRGEDDPGDHLMSVRRVGDTSSATSVEIVASGTATAGDDYRLTPTTLEFAPGEDLKWVTITVLDDAVREGIELAAFTLTNPTNGHRVGVRRRWTHVIADDELKPPTAYATTDANHLVAFTIGDGAFTSDVPITGLAPGETIVALDIGGLNAELFGLGSTSRLYRITPGATEATAVAIGNEPFTPALIGARYGMDLDARFFQLHVIGNGGINVRLDPIQGTHARAPGDPPFYPAGDPHEGATPAIAAVAYTNSIPSADTTTGYAYDLATGALVMLDDSSSRLTTIGPLDVLDVDDMSFDIQQGTNFAFALVTRFQNPELLLVDLTTGHAVQMHPVGPIVPPAKLTGFAVVPSGVIRFVTAGAGTVEGTTATLIVERVGGSAGTLEATLGVLPGGTATPGVDFAAPFASVTFDDGVVGTREIEVATLTDAVVEPTETIPLTIVASPSYVIGNLGTVDVEILDDVLPRISITDVAVMEDDGGPTTAIFTVTLSKPPVLQVSVDFATASQTALAGADFTATAGRIFFDDDVVTQTIAVPVLNDTLIEGTETFVIELTGASNAFIAAAQGVATIKDDDVEPTARTWYLAEGATGAFFDLDILIANPHQESTPVTLTFLKEDATTVVREMTLAPTSRTTVRVDEIAGLEDTAVSTLVTSPTGRPLAVERTMRWDAAGYGAHTEKAVEGPSLTWYFAEGSQGFFFTYLLLANPNATANSATVEYLRQGSSTVTRTYPLAPTSRFTVDVGADDELRDTSFGMIVTFAQPGVAERAMYFGLDPLWLAGHESAGATEPSTTWFLAEGATGPFFETFILLANPQATAAEVTARYLLQDGAPIEKTYIVPASSRLTINIEAEDPALANVAVATQMIASQPIVVERAQYWPFTPDQWYEAHNSFGVTAAGRQWALAEGRTGGGSNYETYILLANPGATASDVTITFLRTSGAPLTKTFTVPAASRLNVATGPNGLIPELVNEEFAAMISSSAPIVVERAMYSTIGGVIWSAGTNATATRFPPTP